MYWPSKGFPVTLCDPQAGGFVGQLEVTAVEILVHGGREGHLDGGHAIHVQAEDLGTGKADHESRHLLTKITFKIW